MKTLNWNKNERCCVFPFTLFVSFDLRHNCFFPWWTTMCWIQYSSLLEQWSMSLMTSSLTSDIKQIFWCWKAFVFNCYYNSYRGRGGLLSEDQTNQLFPSCPWPLLQSVRLITKTLIWKWLFCGILTEIKLVFTRQVLYLKVRAFETRNGLVRSIEDQGIIKG